MCLASVLCNSFNIPTTTNKRATLPGVGVQVSINARFLHDVRNTQTKKAHLLLEDACPLMGESTAKNFELGHHC